MIELRWYAPANEQTVLQYRQMQDHAFYAGAGPFPNSAKNMQWSEWRTVPAYVPGKDES